MGRAPCRDRRAPREVEATSSSLVLKSSLPPRGQDSRIPAGVQQQPGMPADQEQTVCSGCLTDHLRCCCAGRARESSFSPLDQAVHLSPPPGNAAEVEEKQPLLSTGATEQFKVVNWCFMPDNDGFVDRLQQPNKPCTPLLISISGPQDLETPG